jgi:HPt (histidine-containing phosphotransfer) domain-containing protein
MEKPNLSYIENMSGGDTVFEQKIIEIIKNEFPQEKEMYFTNYNSKKYKQASENIHKLKHKISILGLEKSYSIASDFENNLRENNLDLKDEFEAIMQVMTEFLETL